MLVVFEEATEMRKSKPMMVAAGLIWALIGLAYAQANQPQLAHAAALEVIESYGELFLFLIVAITCVNTMEERRTFEVLRVRLVSLGLGFRALFLLTGILSLFMSAMLDNMTTALIMGAVVMALGRGYPLFVAPACMSVVVAANAGGAFCPFGDITTLMVWQQGKLGFFAFFELFLPALLNWLIPAAIMVLAVPNLKPAPQSETFRAKPGMWGVVCLFAVTIALAVAFKNFLSLPPALGMMLGLGLLQIYAYGLKQTGSRRADADMVLDSFHQMQRVEWDTLFFFVGLIFAVGGLGVLGYLDVASERLYSGLGATSANVIIGLLSAVIDNIPLMFAVLTMDPPMSDSQWLLITLTCGTGDSLLSIGSAAGAALMGQARGVYSFSSHLKWSWAVGLGYVAAILAHLWISGLAQ